MMCTYCPNLHPALAIAAFLLARAQAQYNQTYQLQTTELSIVTTAAQKP